MFEDLFQSYPLTLVDVGASGGISSLWEPHRRHLRVVGFEPDARAFENLRSQENPLVTYFNIGLHSHSGQFDFYLTRSQRNSSCFLPNRDLLDRLRNPTRFDIVEKTNITCKALDEVLQEAGLTDIDFIKLDTQGSELAILEGAVSVLADSVFGLEIEVGFTELYKGQPLFSNVDLFVRQYGFDLIDLRTVSWKRSIGAKVGNRRGQLMFADALYFRRPLILQEMLNSADPTFARSKLLRALSVCQIYGFFDYGLELMDMVGLDVFDEFEIRDVQNHLYDQAPSTKRPPRFPGRKRLASFLARLSKWLDPRSSQKVKRPSLGNFQ
jgi:FkbM family methyltransferase